MPVSVFVNSPAGLGCHEIHVGQLTEFIDCCSVN